MLSNMENSATTSSTCPVCFKVVSIKEIDRHVNTCLFLNSGNETTSPKRKREDNESPKQSKIQCSSTSPPSKLSVAQEENNTEFTFTKPLAEALRPTALADFVGQEKIVADGTILHKLLQNGEVPSLILWGPPGCGKTTLANVIKKLMVEKVSGKNNVAYRFIKLHATIAGVDDVKKVIGAAKNEFRMFRKRTILFMDEIHRFNKSQQDTFLPHIEDGTITLIGATTQNPSFSLNSALLSRCRVVTFEKLTTDNLIDILNRAVSFTGGCVCSEEENGDLDSSSDWTIDSETIKWLAEISDGDARIALNSLQMAIQSKPETCTDITLDSVKESIKRSHLLYDRKGDQHYDMISALHKSIRASHDNAALYWLARMLKGGEDPIYIARRLVRAASEDIGLAEPSAVVIAVSTLQGCQAIGMPECDVLLAQLAVYLARCPKSTEVYRALGKAKSNIEQHKGALPAVPLDLRNAPTNLMKDLGYGKYYNTKHKDESGLTYMPEGMQSVSFF